MIYGKDQNIKIYIEETKTENVNVIFLIAGVSFVI